MTTVANQQSQTVSYWVQLRGRVGKLLRSRALRVMIGAHIVVAAVIGVRSQ